MSEASARSLTHGQAPAVSPPNGRPLIAIGVLLFGAAIATLNDGLPAFGLADVRGGFGLGVDQASWLPTILLAAQVVSALIMPSLAVVVGIRPLLTAGTIVLIAASLALPLIRDTNLLFGIQAVRGLAIGLYIPASIIFIMRHLARRWWIWGIAAYAFRFVFSQNVSASIEAFLIERGGWQWIFWKDLPLAIGMLPFVYFGIPREPASPVRLRDLDWNGIAFASTAAAMLYAALDQGERLDWFHSGTITGLLSAGGILFIAFVANERRVSNPFIDLAIFRNVNLATPHLLIAVYSFGTAATAFLVPSYLGHVQGLRSLQIGDTLLWVALPQLIAIPAATLLLRRVDAQLLLGIGLALMAGGAWIDTRLTHAWIGHDFLPALLVEALGLALAIVSLINFTLGHAKPQQARTLGATIQTARLFGAECAVVVMRRIFDLREQLYSNLIGLHVTQAAQAADPTSANLARRFVHLEVDRARAAGQAVGQLARLVSREAHVLAYIDGFWIVAWTLTATLVFIALLLHRPVNAHFQPLSETAI